MSTPTVGLVGSGPAIDAVTAALADVRAETVECDPERVAAADFAVVVGEVGADRFAAANRSAREAGTPWLAIELGGAGGHGIPGVEAAVAGFAPVTACWQCLRTRVAANRDGGKGGDWESDPHEADDGTDVGPASARFAGALAGREAATLLSGGESSALGGVVEIPHAERTLLPVPGCAVCDEQSGPQGDRALDRAHADADLEDALSRAEQAVDERVGVVSTVGEAESFPTPYYLANLADTTGFSDARAAEQAAGVAADWNEALMKALGEALERYAAGVYRTGAFERALAADLDSAVGPAAFVRPDDRADPADDPIAWVEGESLRTGEPTHLPAEFVHFPPPERRYKPSITTGLGLGSSTVEALLSGLYEVVERDAAMLSWYSTSDPLELAVESERFETLRSRARAEGLDVTPLLLTQDVDVPVVAVAVHRDGDWPRFAVGSDADLDPDAAASSALAEALQNWTELRSMGEDDAADADGAIGRYADFPAPAREFVTAETTIPSGSVGPDGIAESAGTSESDDAPDASSDSLAGETELDAVLARLADADCSAYAARLTPRDVEQLGFEAVRVLVPEAQPLFTGEPFFGERAREVPTEMGFEFRPDRDHHPYP